MDFITAWLMLHFGIDAGTLTLYLGVLVAVCNLIGKLIPDSATGPLAIVRKVAKILGLYVGNRITPGVSTNDIAASVAATVPDETIKDAAENLSSAVKLGTDYGDLAGTLLNKGQKQDGRPYAAGQSPEQGSIVPDEFRTDGPFQKAKRKSRAKSTTVRSPMIVSLLALLVLLLAGCTTTQKERFEQQANAICTSVPLAQIAYNVAVQNHDSKTVDLILTTLRLSCPSILNLIHTYPVPAAVAPVASTQAGERG